MKKIFGIMMALAVGMNVFAGMEVVDKGSFAGTGVGAGIAIPAGDGKIVGTQMSAYFGTNKTISVHLPDVQTTVQSTNSTSITSIALYTSSSNIVQGVTLTTSDYLVIESSTSSGIQLSQISAIGVYSSTTKATTYTIATAVTVNHDDKVSISRAGNIMSYAGLPTNVVTQVESPFVGALKKPVYIKVATAGSPDTAVTGTYSVEK